MSNSRRVPYTFSDVAILPYSFDPNSKEFIVGTSKTAVAPLHVLDALIRQDDTLKPAQLAEMFVGFTGGNTILTGPSFKKYSLTKLGGAVVRGSAEVMNQVFQDVYNHANSESSSDPATFTASRQKNGNLELSMYDTPAKLVASPFGEFVKHHDWLTGYGQYNAVSIDRPQTLIALYAGIGYVAYHAQQMG